MSDLWMFNFQSQWSFHLTAVSSYCIYRMSQAWQFTQPDTLAHELSDNVDGLLRHDSVELHQLVMAKSLHDLSFLQEGLRGHGSWLQSLHCYLGGAVPHAWHTDKGILMQRTCGWRDIRGTLALQCFSLPYVSGMTVYTVHVDTTYYIYRDINIHTYSYSINKETTTHNMQVVTNTCVQTPDACKWLLTWRACMTSDGVMLEGRKGNVLVLH